MYKGSEYFIINIHLLTYNLFIFICSYRHTHTNLLSFIEISLLNIITTHNRYAHNKYQMYSGSSRRGYEKKEKDISTCVL